MSLYNCIIIIRGNKTVNIMLYVLKYYGRTILIIQLIFSLSNICDRELEKGYQSTFTTHPEKNIEYQMQISYKEFFIDRY